MNRKKKNFFQDKEEESFYWSHYWSHSIAKVNASNVSATDTFPPSYRAKKNRSLDKIQIYNSILYHAIIIK